MELENCFEVDLPPEKAWAVLLDIDRVATCMPGAELIEIVDELTYRGKVSVRLGPVALSFNGTIVFEEMDAEGKRAQVKAEGTDTKGRGGAAARDGPLDHLESPGSRQNRTPGIPRVQCGRRLSPGCGICR